MTSDVIIFYNMKIREIKVKSILTKTKLGADFAINPYVGCAHACIYCYARFIKKFTGHKEPWGSFIDIKMNAPDLIPKNKNKFKNKSILFGSVTDPYNPFEKKYKITRKILEKLISLQPRIDIITKSNLVLRDIDLLKKFKNLTVVVSLSFLDEKIKKQLEPLASSIKKRIKLIKKLHENKIKTVVFISPIFPEITDWKKVVAKTKIFTKEYWFENLNLYFTIRNNIFDFLKRNCPNLVEEYQEIYSDKNDYWLNEKRKIKKFCNKKNINCKIYFHH